MGGEGELLDRAQERELRLSDCADDSGLGGVGDIFGAEEFEIGAVGHLLLLGLQREFPIEPPDGR